MALPILGALGLAGRGLLGTFGTAARHPFLAAGAVGVADHNMNDGRLRQAATGWAGGNLRDAFTPESTGDWMRLGAFGLATASLMQGNMMNAAMLGAVGYFMNDILSSELFQNVMESATRFLNEHLDLGIPQDWYKGLAGEQDSPAAVSTEEPQSVPAPTAPSMG